MPPAITRSGRDVARETAFLLHLVAILAAVAWLVTRSGTPATGCHNWCWSERDFMVWLAVAFGAPGLAVSTVITDVMLRLSGRNAGPCRSTRRVAGVRPRHVARRRRNGRRRPPDPRVTSTLEQPSDHGRLAIMVGGHMNARQDQDRPWCVLLKTYGRQVLAG
jgi:hypothetical protein